MVDGQYVGGSSGPAVALLNTTEVCRELSKGELVYGPVTDYTYVLPLLLRTCFLQGRFIVI